MASCNIPIPCDSSVSAANQAAFSITNQGQDGIAILADAPDSGFGVVGTSRTGQGIIGLSEGFTGVWGMGAAPNSVGVTGTGAPGLLGVAFGRVGDLHNVGVYGAGGNGPGVRGDATGGPAPNQKYIGVQGRAFPVQDPPTVNVGVEGQANMSNWKNIGVSAAAFNTSGNAVSSIGIYARASKTFPPGWAGWFDGHVVVTGDVNKAGGGFMIDHPLDPANKYLFHSFVESAERKNVYDGIALLDAKGECTVELPEWVETLNSDFRYQLTSIGGPAPNLHVAREISKNRFAIAGGTAKMKVSWQVTGVRRDAWAVGHPLTVEESKSANERGYYLHPDLYRQPPENSTLWKGRADLMREFEEPEEDLPATENLMEEKVTYLMKKMERLRSDDET
jgi:hypothetical protein